MNTITALTQQHAAVLAHLAETESRLDGPEPGAAVAGLARFLRADVSPHFDLEERAVFPLLARHIGDTTGPLAVMHIEHAEFRDVLAHLEEAVAAGTVARQQTLTRRVIALLRSHITKEDHVLFPLALDVLGPDEQAEGDALARGHAATG